MDRQEEEVGKCLNVFSGSDGAPSTAFTSVWHPSIQHRNRSTSERWPTKAAGLVRAVRSPQKKKKVRERACFMTKTSMVWSTLPLSYHQRTQVRAALWILSSHVTLSALGGHIKDGGSTKYMHWHYIIKNSRTREHTLSTHTHTQTYIPNSNLVLKCDRYLDKLFG